MLPGSPLTEVSPSPASTLSSLTPSPPSSPSRKRPRLSSTSPPPRSLTFAEQPDKPSVHLNKTTFDELLAGLDDEDFGAPPSSNPIIPRVDEDDLDEEGLQKGSEQGVVGTAAEAVPPDPPEGDAHSADDSGVGFLPDVELPKDDTAAPPLVEAELPDASAAEGPGEEDVEFEGDDMWLGFDDAEGGFGEPTAFPSSMLSAAGISRNTDKEKRHEEPEEQAAGEFKEEPRLLDFGFTGMDNASQAGGFVFATRKPLVLSSRALERARALLEAEDAEEPSDSVSRPTSAPPAPSGSNAPYVRPAPPTRPSFRPTLSATPTASLAFPLRPSSPQPPSRPPYSDRPPSLPQHALPSFSNFQTASGTTSNAPSADALARAQKALQGSSSPVRPVDSSYPALPLSTTRPPAFLGFQNAAGRTLAMPSEEAMRNARQHLDAPSSSPPSQSAPPSQPPSGPPSRVPSRGQGAQRDVFGESPARLPGIAPDAMRAGGGGNKGGSGSAGGSLAVPFALPPPLARLALEGDLLAPPESPTATRLRSVDLEERSSSGRRTPLVPMDTNFPDVAPLNLERTDAEGVKEQASNTSSTTCRSSSPPPSPHLPHFDVVLPPPPHSTAPVVALLPPVAPLVAPVPVRPALPASVSSTSASASTSRASSVRPFRSPFVSGVSTPSRGPASAFTPLRSSALATSSAAPAPALPTSTPNPLLQHRRLNLGMTPRSKPYHLANTRSGTLAASQHASMNGGVGPRTGVKAFKTPFRGGRPPDGLTPAGLKGKMEPPSISKEVVGDSIKKPARPGKEKVALDGQRDKAKVFELGAAPTDRFDLLNFGMRPQTHYYEELEGLRLPSAILEINSTSAASYAFPCGSSSRTAFDALQTLVAARMPSEKDLVTLPWVQNHWSLILWKIASYVRSRPDLLVEWWTFARVMDQLRYRYEREINLAQRSCIKRIQEQDSPASLPMVLCVSQIRWDEPSDNDPAPPAAPADGSSSLVIVGLELTDGWYRIRANVDTTLRSACERGKIVVGSKLAVMGAKLDATRNEGTDVLQALSRSNLVISGNSTSLASWHAPLGFRRDAFVAGLNGLNSTGGLVPLLDVTVERTFPRGFIDLRKGRSADTWGEEEERTRAEEWKRGRKKIEARLADEAEKAGVEEDEVVELLQEAAQRLDPSPNRHRSHTPSEEPDEILDRLEAASNKHAIIRKLSPRQVRDCLALAQENAQQSRYRAVEDLQKELADKYPPRDVRSFRAVRVRDAREGSKPSTRTALLTVWDVQTGEDGFVKEGGRYLIWNTVPKGNWRKTDLEIVLATRRDTRWKKI
ncbi:hypothetical protein JCM11641_000443 [Rhodosporidiobolus odoratus]